MYPFLRRSSKMKRCDMFQRVFRGPNGAPGYTEGSWIVQSGDRKSVLTTMPFECDESPAPNPHCPIDGCPESGGLPNGPAATGYCEAFHRKCYANRQSRTFDTNLKNMVYTWKPSNNCHMSPISIMSSSQYAAWASSIEHAAGPILFLGDSLVWELFYAFRASTP